MLICLNSCKNHSALFIQFALYFHYSNVINFHKYIIIHECGAGPSIILGTFYAVIACAVYAAYSKMGVWYEYNNNVYLQLFMW